MAYIIGQAIGLVTMVQCLIAPFFKKKWQMLVNGMLMNLFMAINYALIGVMGSAFFMAMVGVVQALVTLLHTLKDKNVPMAEQLIFFVISVGSGFYGMITAPGFVLGINFKNMLELLPIIGAVLGMISVFKRDEQETRKYLFLNASIWSVYTAVIMSTTFFAEFIAAVSTAIAMYKYRKKKDA